MSDKFPEILILDIIQKYIDSGIPKLASVCPISLCLKDMYPYYWIQTSSDIHISRWFAGLRSGGSSHYKLPFYALEFIRDFDDGKPVRPFSFTAELIHDKVG